MENSTAEILAVTRGERSAPAGAVALPLTKGLFAIVDEADHALVSAWKWTALRAHQNLENWYAVRYQRTHGRQVKVRMHRVVLIVPAGAEIDHANGNGLDNRRCNLRRCDRSLNTANTRQKMGESGFRGVFRNGGRWVACIQVDRVRSKIATFDDPSEAARAYDAAALAAFGDFAVLNFPVDAALAA